MDLLSYLTTQYPALLYIIGGLGIGVVAYGSYVKLTPNKDDDEAWEKIKQHKIWGALIRLVSKSQKKEDK